MKDLFDDLSRELNKINRGNVRSLNKINRDNAKKFKQLTSVQIKSLIAKEGRVRIPAKRRHEVEGKYYNKCAKCSKKSPLQIHHINQKNNDNALRNLILLCANHHCELHSKGKNKKRKPKSSPFSF